MNSLQLFLRQLFARNRLLAWTGAAHFAAFVCFLVFAAFDHRTVMGINTWIKPMKFALSIGIFCWTMAWMLSHLLEQPQPKERAVRFISRGIVVAMVTEMICIAGQAARGIPSHFNITSPLNGAIFSFMGVMILFNTALLAYTALLFFRHAHHLPTSYRWGIVSGLIISILASAEGGYMSAMLRHSVGVTDGGVGLPFVNWSTEGGDLRAAHFFGLHALQVLPLLGWWFHHHSERAEQMPSPSTPTTPRRFSAATWTLVASLLYGAAVTAVFLRALTGRPFLFLFLFL